MRLSIVHDSAGNISRLVASPPDAPMAHLGTNSGESVVEVDAPEIELSLGAETISERLADLLENYKVEIGSASLAPRD